MTDILDGRTFRIICGDAMETLRTLPAESVHCCVTSPPYWGLRDYGADGQIGLEATPELFVARLVEVFREVRRVLRDDGTLWMNLGDAYCSGTASPRKPTSTSGAAVPAGWAGRCQKERIAAVGDIKAKDLIGIPWMVAFALRADGWYLRSDIIWSKPNPMPESVTDRPTKAHEYLFLLSKSERYFYDADAIKEPLSESVLRKPYKLQFSEERPEIGSTSRSRGRRGAVRKAESDPSSDPAPAGRNRRSVWTIGTQPFPEAHFATFPPALVEPCIKAGTSEHGVCADCGAPWERVVEGRAAVDTGAAIGGEPSRKDGGTRERDTTGRGGNRLAVRTVGTNTWRPGCDHEAQPVPAVVLDPFSGAGTTALVATRLRRRAIGIELNPAYVAMSERRIRGDAPLFHGAA